MANSPLLVPIDVWSDIACPWCYVGKARLEKAVSSIEQSSGGAVKVQVNWHAYMIDPRTARGGEPYLDYNRRRWGSDGWTRELRRSAEKDGLQFASWRWWPNTLQGHRLVHLAKQHGKGSEAKSLLLQLTYEEGQNISQIEVLKAAGEALGLPSVGSYLESDEGLAEVIEDDRIGKQEKDIHGVPYFIIDNQISLSGAQPSSAFVAALSRVIATKEQD